MHQNIQDRTTKICPKCKDVLISCTKEEQPVRCPVCDESFLSEEKNSLKWTMTEPTSEQVNNTNQDQIKCKEEVAQEPTTSIKPEVDDDQLSFQSVSRTTSPTFSSDDELDEILNWDLSDGTLFPETYHLQNGTLNETDFLSD